MDPPFFIAFIWLGVNATFYGMFSSTAKLRISIICDNESLYPALEPLWAFHASSTLKVKAYYLILMVSQTLLGNGNMAKMGIDASEISIVMILHAHADHIGGLTEFLKVNSNVKVYLPLSLS